MKHGHAARTCRIDIDTSAWTLSMNIPHGHAASTCSLNMPTPHSRTQFFPPPSEFGLWNWVSSEFQQREEKCELALFSFALGAFAFLHLFYLVLLGSFLLCGRERESAIKCRCSSLFIGNEKCPKFFSPATLYYLQMVGWA